MAIPKQSVVWDEKRNTSKVHAVPPGALDEALKACRALATQQPELVQWLRDGHPTLTHEQHHARFGEPYKR